MQQLKLADRRVVQSLWNRKFSKRNIAKELGCSPQTICNEINNLSNLDFLRVGKKVVKTYSAEKAQANYERNKGKCGAKCKLKKDPRLRIWVEQNMLAKREERKYPDELIERKKLDGWDFEQTITSRSIYNYVHGLNKCKFAVKPHDLLRTVNRNTKKPRSHENVRILGESVEKREQIINERGRFGDFECDTVVDRGHNGVLVLYERVSRKYFILKLDTHCTAKETKEKLAMLKNELGEKMKSVTYDNGSEFYLAASLSTEIFHSYFTHTYCSWEKGGIENCNGILRRYFPKGTDFSQITQADCDRICGHINNKARKILGWYTANEAFEYLSTTTECWTNIFQNGKVKMNNFLSKCPL